MKTPYKAERKIILNAIQHFKEEGDLESVKELKQELIDLKHARHTKRGTK